MNFSVSLKASFLQKKKVSFVFFYSFCFLLLGVNAGFAQNTQPCMSDEVLAEQIKSNPAIKDQMTWLNNYVRNYKENARLRGDNDTIRIIPVVFQVFHYNGAEDISEAQIRSQIDVLNIDYRRLNPDTVNLTNAYLDTFSKHGIYGADLKIQFRLATIDPNGNCTNGIVRYYTPFTENADDGIKALSGWPTDKYLNIWVVKNIKPTGLEPGLIIGGYAQFPFVTPGGTFTYFSDGVIIRSDYIGNIGTSDNVTKKGRVATHEIGHWFGLFHPFQDSCRDGDEVADTPPVKTPSFNDPKTGACLYHRNSCHGDLPDLPDLVPDFMDYADGSCQNLFTRGQRDRVNATIQAWRWAYSTHENLVATGTLDSGIVTNCNPIAAFDAPLTTACEGGTIQFYDYSYNTTISSWKWSFPGGTPATSTLKNPLAITYANAGDYDVTLIAKGVNGQFDTLTQKALIHINPTNAWLPGMHEDMEESGFPYQWTASSGNSTGKWERTTQAYHEGSACMMVNNQGNTIGDIIDFVSPSINLSYASSKSLSFYYAYTPRLDGNTNGATQDRLVVQISVNCGKTWSNLFSKAGSTLNTLTAVTTNQYAGQFYAVLPTDWKQVNISLASYANTTNALFRFEFTSAAGNNIFIDDINLGTVTGIEAPEKVTATLDIFPNPATESTTLRYDVNSRAQVQISLFDITGRKLISLLNATVVPGTYEISLGEEQLSKLSKGTYLVELQTPGQLITKKLIVI